MPLPKGRLAHGNDNPLPFITAPEWMEEAACRYANPDLFHQPTHNGLSRSGAEKEARERLRIADAKSYCEQCPVISQCLREAKKTNDTWAIMGGLTPNERRRLGKRENGAAAS